MAASIQLIPASTVHFHDGRSLAEFPPAGSTASAELDALLMPESVLGEGCFGKVLRMTYNGGRVAVKQLSFDTLDEGSIGASVSVTSFFPLYYNSFMCTDMMTRPGRGNG